MATTVLITGIEFTQSDKALTLIGKLQIARFKVQSKLKIAKHLGGRKTQYLASLNCYKHLLAYVLMIDC